jgi:L-alanine-DL-glutamate epimerase-like enolase superfamily enzyme
MGCISGIDIALWDILGKAAGMPISKLLGLHSDKVPAYASGGFYAPGKDLDGLKREVEGYQKKGYADIKIKIGRNPELLGNAVRYTAGTDFTVRYEEDIKRIAAVRKIMGKEGRLAADINAAWPVEEVLRASADFCEAGLNWLEEPILFEDVEGLKKIGKGLLGISLVGYETAQGCKNYVNLMKQNAMDIVQPDVGWGGGISELRKIGLAAQGFSKPISLHSFGSAVHFAASLHLAASFPNTEAIESEENHNFLKTGVLKTPFEHDEHMNFYVPQLPGLGIEIDWDSVEKIKVF